MLALLIAAPAYNGALLHSRIAPRVTVARAIIEPELYQECAIYDADMDAKMSELKVQLAEATAAASRLSEVEAEAADTNEALKAAKLTIAKLEASALTQKGEIEDLRGNVAGLEAQVGSLESALTEEQANAVQAAADLRGDVERERAAVVAKAREAQEAEEAAAELKGAKAMAEYEAAKVKSELAQEKAKAAREAARLVGELDASKADNAELLKAIQKIANKVQTVTAKVESQKEAASTGEE
jgi:colicin import membrane protein